MTAKTFSLIVPTFNFTWFEELLVCVLLQPTEVWFAEDILTNQARHMQGKQNDWWPNLIGYFSVREQFTRWLRVTVSLTRTPEEKQSHCLCFLRHLRGQNVSNQTPFVEIIHEVYILQTRSTLVYEAIHFSKQCWRSRALCHWVVHCSFSGTAALCSHKEP